MENLSDIYTMIPRQRKTWQQQRKEKSHTVNHFSHKLPKTKYLEQVALDLVRQLNYCRATESHASVSFLLVCVIPQREKKIRKSHLVPTNSKEINNYLIIIFWKKQKNGSVTIRNYLRLHRNALEEAPSIPEYYSFPSFLFFFSFPARNSTEFWISVFLKLKSHKTRFCYRAVRLNYLRIRKPKLEWKASQLRSVSRGQKILRSELNRNRI